MNWYLINTTYNAKQLQLMFYSSQNTAMTAMLLASQSGGAQMFVYGSNTWQPMGPAFPVNY